jgi:acyl-CoA dehydrogenase
MQFQSYSYGLNHFEHDLGLQAVLRHYWPEAQYQGAALSAFGKLVGADAMELGYHIDRDAAPVLIMHDLDGRRVDRVRLSPAHRNLLPRLAEINRPPYAGGSWHHHYALGYLLADPGLYCLVTISNNVVYAIHKYAPEHRSWVEKLLRGDAFGATWMTESQGGSDLGANVLQAAPDGDVWRLQGEKYFCSGAGLTDIAIVTARPHGGREGSKGLALFLVPRLDRRGELNFRVRRLKDKSATRAVPSGEVEFDRSEAWLIGTAELGIYYTLESLLLSRLANAVAAMGIARKAQFEAQLRTATRRSFGAPLCDHALVRRDLTDMAVRMAGGLALSFHAVDLFDRAWRETPPYGVAYHHARFVAHLAKNRTAEHAGAITQLAMELFGGLGFLEEYGIARWHREALITPIWEGTSNIQALDMLETMLKKNAHEPFLERIENLLHAYAGADCAPVLEALHRQVAQLSSSPAAQWHAKDGLTQFSDCAQVALLYALADSAGERYAKLARLYCARFVQHEDYPSWAGESSELWGLPA